MKDRTPKLNYIRGKWKKQVSKWVFDHYLNLGIFNMVLALLVLLRSAGYFHPYFPISINFITLFMLLASIFLLNLRSSGMLTTFIAFWSFAAMLKIINIDIWSERTAVYAFQALVLGFLLFVVETITFKKTK